MADAEDRLQGDGRSPLLDFRARVVDALVADAPADYDEAMEATPVAPGWVRVPVFVAALVLSWTLIILFAVAVWHAASRPKLDRHPVNGPARGFSSARGKIVALSS